MYVDILLRPTASDYFPSFIPMRLSKKPFPYSRMGETIDLFEKNVIAIKSEEFNQNKMEEYSGVYRFFGTKYYCFTYDKTKEEFVEYIFEKVDTSRPWTIVKTMESGEHLHYLRDDERYEVLDKELNYCKYI